eukprot:scaffold350_cov313-Prasinococcus_capsulatus_cf.AAC.5
MRRHTCGGAAQVLTPICCCGSRWARFYSIAMLGPASSQLVYSLKILTTALTLKLALRRYYSTMQWLAIALLTVRRHVRPPRALLVLARGDAACSCLRLGWGRWGGKPELARAADGICAYDLHVLPVELCRGTPRPLRRPIAPCAAAAADAPGRMRALTRCPTSSC